MAWPPICDTQCGMTTCGFTLLCFRVAETVCSDFPVTFLGFNSSVRTNVVIVAVLTRYRSAVRARGEAFASDCFGL